MLAAHRGHQQVLDMLLASPKIDVNLQDEVRVFLISNCQGSIFLLYHMLYNHRTEALSFTLRPCAITSL